MTGHSSTTGRDASGAVARRTRRQLLAGGTGALAAVLSAEALARPAPASAADGDNLVLGQNNSATSQTTITSSNQFTVLEVDATSDTGTAVTGTSAGIGFGVTGLSRTGSGVVGLCGPGAGAGGNGQIGVEGHSVNGDGVVGRSGFPTSNLASGRNGVHGMTDDPLGAGVFGENVNGTAVSGLSGGSDGVSGGSGSGNGVSGVSDSGNGVFGTSDSSNGLLGTSLSGRGVLGISGSTEPGSGSAANGVHGVSDNPSGAGVIGENASGNAVHGVSSTGIAVLAECPSGTGVQATGATALSVQGPAVFSRSGALTIAAGMRSATQAGVGLTAASLVLVTPQDDVLGVVVRSAVPDVAAGSFTVHLARAVAQNVTVGWFVVN